MGGRGLAVRMLQEQLQKLGYFDHELTGLYGDVTKLSLAAFISYVGIGETADELTERTAAYLAAAAAVHNSATNVVFIGKESSISDIQKAQRTMRYLGYYRGRTDGQYTSVLFHAIVAYQTDHQLVGNATSPGAGSIGPITKSVLDKELNKRRIARRAEEILALHRVQKVLDEKGSLMRTTMKEGSSGSDVKVLQTILAHKGFFPKEKINGNYGPLTARAVASYQIAKELLQSESDKGAGTVGPVTLKTLREEHVRQVYRLVKAQGWGVL